MESGDADFINKKWLSDWAAERNLTTSSSFEVIPDNLLEELNEDPKCFSTNFLAKFFHPKSDYFGVKLYEDLNPGAMVR